MSEQWENEISCPFYNFFEKKWEFRNFLSKSSLLQWQFTFPKKMKTCFHTCKMRLKAKKSRFSLVLIESVRCENFFVFCSYFFLKQYWNGNVDIVHLETIPKESEMCSVEHQNAQKLEFLQKPPVDSMFKNMRIWDLMKMLILCTWRRFQKIQKMCSVGTKMIEKEWIGRDSGPDGSENTSKWTFENTHIPSK